MTTVAATATGETDVPARLDRLPWCAFHARLIVALGVTWILDGLEVTLAGALSGALQESPTLRFDAADIGLAGSAYLAGAVVGAIGFGWLTDRWGRRRLFFVTLGLYLVATALTATAHDIWTFALWRMLTGAGIGGEYAAINSAIQELIPARHRGRTDLIVNGSFWLGAAIGAAGALVLLDPGFLPPDMGWRVAFGIGAALGIVVLALRSMIPESPRWLMTKGRIAEAEAIVAMIEASARMVPPRDLPRLRIAIGRPQPGFIALFRTLLRTHPRRTMLGLVLMAAQAFFYNAIFFTYALVLTTFEQVPAGEIGLYLLPFSIANFIGPVVLGPLFDLWGRRQMIGSTFAASGLLLGAATLVFLNGGGAVGLTFAWTITFFVASAAASSAYLTVGELFPLELRARTIALFYAVGTGIGGLLGPWLFGHLIATREPGVLAWGYAGAAIAMVAAGLVAWRWGIAAERRPLEEVGGLLSRAD